MPTPADREKALETALAQIDRQFGKGSVMRLGSDERAPVAVIPTGSIALDVALGIGGLPRGRIVEIYGPESSGKTTLTLSVIAQIQKLGGTVVARGLSISTTTSDSGFVRSSPCCPARSASTAGSS